MMTLNEGQHLLDGFVKVAIYDRILETAVQLHFLPSILTSHGELLSCFGSASPQTTMEFARRGGQDEHRNSAGIRPLQTERSLDVDVQQHYPTLMPYPLEWAARRAIVVQMNFAGFREKTGFLQFHKLLLGDEEILPSMALAGTPGTSGIRH